MIAQHFERAGDLPNVVRHVTIAALETYRANDLAGRYRTRQARHRRRRRELRTRVRDPTRRAAFLALPEQRELLA